MTPKPRTDDHDVFVSYASQDAAIAQKACLVLEAAGFRCWIAPRDVVPGTLYAAGIVGAIDESRILVLILSKDAVASAHVGKELERATSKRHPIIALRLDTAPLTRAFEYFLNESQWIEVGAGNADTAIEKLVGAVGQHLAPGTASLPTSGNQSSAVPRKAAGPRRTWAIAGVVVAVLLAGGYLVDKELHSKHETTASTAVISDKSIAVLPFTDMSEKKDQEYFADGMAEEIIDLLVKIPGLKVISRTSSFQFKGKTEDLHSIGTQLGVAYVLQGSVRKSGDRLRVTAQLINSRDGSQLWSQTYDRELSDVLKMQDEIAIALVRALQIEVGTDEVSFRPALRNAEAYTLYLQGEHAADSFNQQGLEQAVGYFQRAIELDTSFAAAEVELGRVYSALGVYGFMSPSVALEKARLADEAAVKLDPNLAVAHAALGDIHRGYDWDWAAADREFYLALTLAPNDGNVLFLSAIQSLSTGRLDEALLRMNAASAKSPLSPDPYTILCIIQLRRGRPVEAEAAARRALELRPTYSGGHYFLAIALLVRGEPRAALMEAMKETQEAVRLGASAMAFFALRRVTMAKRMHAKLAEIKQQLRRRLHGRMREVGAWLHKVLQGFYNYHAVPGNLRRLWSMRYRLLHAWWRILGRRSQLRMSWDRYFSRVRTWLPEPRVLHPYPDARFRATHSR
jgi:TolB-like protein/Tfp pilus assembly protein PilF